MSEMAVPATCARDAAALVFVGSFNPSLYQPKWLGSTELLRAADVADAQHLIILPDLCSFKVGDWLSFEATTDRLQVSTDKIEHALLLRDFGVNLFRILEHTPLRSIGINRAMHWRLLTAEARDVLGKRLASPAEWPSSIVDPLMISLTMKTKRPASDGVLNITVEPSAVLEQPFGVFVRMNEHFDAQADEGATMFVDRVIGKQFEASFPFAREVSEQILKGDRRG